MFHVYLYNNESILFLQHKQHIPFLTLSHLGSSFSKAFAQTSTSDKRRKKLPQQITSSEDQG